MAVAVEAAAVAGPGGAGVRGVGGGAAVLPTPPLHPTPTPPSLARPLMPI